MYSTSVSSTYVSQDRTSCLHLFAEYQTSNVYTFWRSICQVVFSTYTVLYCRKIPLQSTVYSTLYCTIERYLYTQSTLYSTLYCTVERYLYSLHSTVRYTVLYCTVERYLHLQSTVYIQYFPCLTSREHLLSLRVHLISRSLHKMDPN